MDFIERFKRIFSGHSEDALPNKTLNDIYNTFITAPAFSFKQFEAFNLIPDSDQKYKEDIIVLFNQAIEEKDGELLKFCIGASSKDGIDNDYIEIFEKLILEQWHDEHEDIVDIVCQFKDDRFTDALLEIATNPEIYRKFDDEMESTLRKCFHALKAIDSEKSDAAIELLINTKNPNIEFVVDMYK